VLKLNLKPSALSSSTAAQPTSVPAAVPAVPRAPSVLPAGALPRIRVKSAAAASHKIKIRNQRDAGLGYDSEASDREDDPAIEEQIILRCRPGEDADYLKSCLERKEVPDIMIKFKGSPAVPLAPNLYALCLYVPGANHVDPRRAVVRIRKNLYAAKLVDLPTIIESSKTLDKKGLYKTADICQMLMMGEPISHEETILAYPSKSSDYIYPHGLTPPLRWVRKRRFRKRISNRVRPSPPFPVIALFLSVWRYSR
jgi:transcription initiation factor TFIID subunit 7